MCMVVIHVPVLVSTELDQIMGHHTLGWVIFPESFVLFRLTMSELFEMICEKEHLNSAEHQLSLPRTGTRRVTFDSGTAVGSLKIREVSIIRTVLSDNNCIGLAEPEEEFPEDLLDFEGEEVTMLTCHYNYIDTL